MTLDQSHRKRSFTISVRARVAMRTMRMILFGVCVNRFVVSAFAAVTALPFLLLILVSLKRRMWYCAFKFNAACIELYGSGDKAAPLFIWALSFFHRSHTLDQMQVYTVRSQSKSKRKRK